MFDTNRPNPKPPGRPSVHEAIARNQISSGGAALLLGIGDYAVRTAIMNGDITTIEHNPRKRENGSTRSKELRFDINDLAAYAVKLYQEKQKPITPLLVSTVNKFGTYQTKRMIKRAATGLELIYIAELTTHPKIPVSIAIDGYIAAPHQKRIEIIEGGRVLKEMIHTDRDYMKEATKEGVYSDYLAAGDEYHMPDAALVIPSDDPDFARMCMLYGLLKAETNKSAGEAIVARALHHGYKLLERKKDKNELKFDMEVKKIEEVQAAARAAMMKPNTASNVPKSAADAAAALRSGIKNDTPEDTSENTPT